MTPPIYPEDHLWLCRVKWVRRGDGKPYGGVTPIAYRDEQASAWVELSEHDAALAFPDQGTAFWFDVPSDAEEESLVLIRAERQDHYDSGKDAYKVVRWAFAYEVVDLRPWEDPRSQRLALTGEGLPIRLTTPRVYLRLTDDEAVGPVALAPRPDRRWGIPDAHADELKVVRLAGDHSAPVQVDGRKAEILLDRDDLGAPTRYVNWASDRALAEGLLNRLLKMDRAAAQGLGVAKAAFKTYLDAYPGFEYASDHQHRQENARYERVEELLAVVEADEALLQSAAQALLLHPTIEEALAEPKRQAVEAAVQAAREAFEAGAEERRLALDDELEAKRKQLDLDLAAARQALAEARAGLEAVSELKTEAHAELNGLQSTLDALRTEVDQQADDVEQALDARLAELAERPAQAFAEIAILRAISGTPQTPPRSSAGTAAAPPPIETDPPVAAQIEALAKAGGAVFQRLNADDHLVGAALLAAFATGRAVVVAGDGAADALHAVAEGVAGGRSTWIPVSATLSDAASLLTQPAHGTVWPNPGGLLDAVERAADGRLALVVLEGFDRAASDHYLDPLLQCYADARHGRGARTLPYLGIDGAPRRLAWPPNLLLACVPSGGPSALPPGATFWTHAVLSDVGDVSRGPEEGLSEVAPATWDAAVQAGTDGGEVPSLTDDLKPSVAAMRSAAALYHAALAFNVPEPDARQLAFLGAVLPHVATDPSAAKAVEASVVPDRVPRALRLLDILAP